MKRLPIIVTLLAVASATLTIRAECLGPPIQIYLFKPLTMALILFLAFGSGRSKVPSYKYAIIAGLACSTTGDIFLMLPSDQFIAGLTSFLGAHLFYILGFTRGRRFRFSWWLLTPYVLYGITIYSILWPYLGEMQLPVLVYLAVILVMGWQALERWGCNRGTSGLLAFAGAALFILSDTILALNRFRESFDLARVLTLSTYFSAQWLIAMSIKEDPIS